VTGLKIKEKRMRRIGSAGILMCIILFGASFFASGSGWEYFNLIAFTVVFSGTIGATLLSFPLSRIVAAIKTVHEIFTSPPLDRSILKDQLIDLAVRSACQGPACYEDIEDKKETEGFLRQSVACLADNYTLDEVRDVMSNQANAYAFERSQNERVFRRMASLAPAFGVAGSVIGLIGMLMGIGNSEILLDQIPIALVSTLYGIVFGNFIFIPMAESIASDTSEGIMRQQMIFEAVKDVLNQTHPYKLARKLEPFSPGRTGRDELQLIREKRKACLGDAGQVTEEGG
jgi:chemotaxis protein MotA